MTTQKLNNFRLPATLTGAGMRGWIVAAVMLTGIGASAITAHGAEATLPKTTDPIDQACPTGQVVVHFFAPHTDGLAVGHVSMTLPDGTYISWSPQERRLVSPAVVNRTLAQDIVGEKETPVDYPITGVNAADIQTWWEDFRRTNKLWVASGPNCTTVVEDALRAGGAENVPTKQQAWFPEAFLPSLERMSGTSVAVSSRLP